MLVGVEDHRGVHMPHEVGHTADVGAAGQGIGGECVAEIVGADTPGDAGSRQGGMPCPANAAHGSAPPGNDIPDALARIMPPPCLQNWDQIGADWNVASVLKVVFLSAGHA